MEHIVASFEYSEIVSYLNALLLMTLFAFLNQCFARLFLLVGGFVYFFRALHQHFCSV